MKKSKWVVKKVVAVVLSLVLVMGLAMPAMAQTTATTDGFTPVWVVPPPLGVTDFWLCICGDFVDSQDRVIDRTTGSVTTQYHYGHGGGQSGWVYDPALNLIGLPGYSDEYQYYFGMHPSNEFQNFLASLGWMAEFYGPITRGLIVVWEVDYTMRQTRDWWLESEWTADWWYLPLEAYSGRAALMYNMQLVTDFEFDSLSSLMRPFDEPVFEFFAAQIGDRWGLIDRHGNTVIPYVFSNLMLINENTAFANFNGSYGILDLNQTMANAAAVSQLPHNLNTASDWAHEGITNAITAGLVPESLQNHYTNNITRAEFTSLAVLLYETVTDREITGRVNFNDTNDVNVQKAAYIGIVSGTGDNNFSPNMQFNREQAAVILTRLADAIGQPLPQAAAAFADNAQISSWALDSVGQVQDAGIMGGVGNNVFDPQGVFTREQSIVTILRLFDVF